MHNGPWPWIICIEASSQNPQENLRGCAGRTGEGADGQGKVELSRPRRREKIPTGGEKGAGHDGVGKRFNPATLDV